MATIEITNFGGRLTRILNGNLNSGFAKFSPSFGYDPFSKPMNLTWLETPTSIAGINSLPQAAKITVDNTDRLNVHVISQNGNWYQIRASSASNANINSVIGVASVSTINYLRGTSMEFFGSIVGADISGVNLPKLYVGGDEGVVSVNPDGSAEAAVGTAANYLPDIFRPLKQFGGNLVFGNGNTIGLIGPTGTVTSSILGTGSGGNIYSELNPQLGTLSRIYDMEVSPSNDYINLATANVIYSESLNFQEDDFVQSISSAGGKIFQWNGVDRTVTAASSYPSYFISSIETFFKNIWFFAQDAFGATFNNDVGKVVSLPNNRAPMPNAVSTNGNFVTFAVPESDSSNRYLSLYYYGALDQENPSGLYRLLRWTTTQSSGFVSKVPLNILVSGSYVSILTNPTGVTRMGLGKHYIGVNSVNSSAGATYLLVFLVTSTGTGTPQLGVYETQTQLFSKRIGVSQVRVYCEPTVTGNGFRIDLIGSDGAVVSGGTMTYAFGDVTDPQSGSTAVERITFNPSTKTQYALGVRITNTGTTNMTIKKIELDINEEGK